ncbi:MAG: hypothetical protein LQ338_002769 [Usnochroma carphineum]|nr:MAG: hypothetical protein LQ338_002769 [Usnochroma carphineum]
MPTEDLTTAVLCESSDPALDCSQQTETKVRILAAIPRSGSTLMMRVFREAAECAVTSRLVLMGNYSSGAGFRPDYTIFHDPASHKVYQEAQASGKSILVSKEELGHDSSKGECDYDIFPDEASIMSTKAAFLFRDPLRVFDSWKAVGWTDIESLIIAYSNLYRTWSTSDQSAIALTYEELISHPERTIKRLCRRFGIRYSHYLLSFHHPFAEFLFSSERERQIYAVHNPLGLFSTVQSNQTVNAAIKSHGLLTMAEKDQIEQSLGGMYMDTYGKRIKPVREALLQKTHFGFDLDDTLHEFRRASGIASASVFEYLAAHSTTSSEVYKATYAKILAESTSGAFADGKTSADYRTKRFTALMQAHGVQITDNLLRHLLDVYKTSLQAALALKSGASDLLSKLRALDKKVILVTEGPEDAQQWTLENLGIAAKVDMLVTSNKVGKTKVDGLFAVVLDQLGIDAKDFVFIGDNMARDILPARSEGILAVHYDELDHVRLELEDLRINSLWKLSELLPKPTDDAG